MKRFAVRLVKETALAVSELSEAPGRLVVGFGLWRAILSLVLALAVVAPAKAQKFDNGAIPTFPPIAVGETQRFVMTFTAYQLRTFTEVRHDSLIKFRTAFVDDKDDSVVINWRDIRRSSNKGVPAKDGNNYQVIRTRKVLFNGATNAFSDAKWKHGGYEAWEIILGFGENYTFSTRLIKDGEGPDNTTRERFQPDGEIWIIAPTFWGVTLNGGRNLRDPISWPYPLIWWQKDTYGIELTFTRSRPGQ